MVRLIAAIDSKLGIANDSGIPWQGRIPNEVGYFRKQILNHTILMGYGTYAEFDKPFPGSRNVVASNRDFDIKPGFERITDAVEFIKACHEDVWVIGGSVIFEQTIALADELYLTQLAEDFNCTKFFPEFTSRFKLKSCSENNISYQFQVWDKK